MTRRITIEPVTRIEGHAVVTIALGDDGRVRDARVHVTELRGFEVFCVGRLLREMPALTSRVCGICPVSHALASAKAGDAVLAVEPPPAARKLRRLLQLAALVQSHALSFFQLSAPDFVGSPGDDPTRQSLFGAAEAAPGLAADGIALRRFGQGAIESLAGRRVHADFAVPGGVTRPLGPAVREALLAALPDALSRACRTLSWWWERWPDAGPRPGAGADAAAALEQDGLFLALVGPSGELAHDDGRLRVISTRGEVLADGVDPARYRELVAEEVEPWTYARLAYWRALGYPAGAYRVGPLARLNVIQHCGTPLADAALLRFRSLADGPVRSTFHAHAARLVEIVFALERMRELLTDAAILDRDVLAPAPPAEAWRGEGVGACEAPRGTLFHRYRVDRDGVVRCVDLLVPTGENTLAMNETVRRLAERWLVGSEITPDLLNRVEAGLRAFDPCLSCATHAAGKERVVLRLVGPGGEVLDEASARTCPSGREVRTGEAPTSLR